MSAPEPILAVDDSAPIREMIVSVLKPHGHHVITASNGQEALLRLHSFQEPYCRITGYRDAGAGRHSRLQRGRTRP